MVETETPLMLLNMENGGERSVKSRLELERAIAALGASGNCFATLSRDSGAYVQAATTDATRFAVEYCDSPDGPRWRSTREDLTLEQVTTLFVAYFDGMSTWGGALAWRRIDAPERDGDEAWPPRVLLVLGTVLLCAAAIAGYRAQIASVHLRDAVGELVSLRDCGKGHDCVAVRYTVDGTPYIAEASVRRGTIRPRQPLRLVVDTRDPSSAWVEGARAVWYPFQGLAGLAGLFLTAACVSYVRRKVRRRRSDAASTL